MIIKKKKIQFPVQINSLEGITPILTMKKEKLNKLEINNSS